MSGEIISVHEMKRFLIECFAALGVSGLQSEIMSECLVDADTIGHHSHGVFRLDKFINEIQKGCADIQSSPKIEKETAATAWVNGRNSLGPVVGSFCIELAIAKAKKIGAAIVVANNSNNFGVASHYTKQALEEGLIGLTFTNSSALMLPNRAKYPISGTNPISVAAPGINDFFLLDMATTVVSGGKLEIKCKTNEFLPDGWAANAACIPETNGDVAVKSGRFLPLGSREESGSYKGTGLSIMVDILCGILGGACYSEMIDSWTNQSRARANVGHCFIVIDPKFFAPGFEIRMSEFLASIRNAEPKDPTKPVRVAGDRKKEIDEIVEEFGGIWYPQYIIDYLKKTSDVFKIRDISYIPKPVPERLTSSEELAAFFEAEKRVSETQEGIESIYSEKEIPLAENPSDDISSLKIEDSSDWLCPFSDEKKTKKKETDILEKKRKQLIKNEKLSTGPLVSQTTVLSYGEDVPFFTKLDESLEN